MTKMDYGLTLGLIGAAIALVAAVPYMVAIWRGHRPPYTTYIAWSVIGLTGFFFQVEAVREEGAHWASTLVPAAYALVPFVYVVLLLYKKAPWELGKRDVICFTGAGISWIIWLIAWYYELGMLLPLLANIATDFFSSYPILDDARKGKEGGDSERWSWGLTALAAVFGLLSVGALWTLTAVFPLYLVVMMGAIAWFSLTRRTMQGEPV